MHHINISTLSVARLPDYSIINAMHVIAWFGLLPGLFVDGSLLEPGVVHCGLNGGEESQELLSPCLVELTGSMWGLT